jgi:hypothetical protein
MASTDWTYLTDGLPIASVDRGVTAGGPTVPNGSGNLYTFGFNSIVAASGAVGLYCNLANFAPLASGGSIRGCVQRAAGGGPTNFSPFLFLCLQGNSVNDHGYLLGLSDDAPHKIVLKKGTLASGIPSASSTESGILAKSSGTFEVGVWHHLRLDAIVNTNGDVVLRCYQNDLNAHTVTAPTWSAIEGISAVIDDQLGVNSGSQPYTSGYAGFGFECSDVTRRSYFDYLELQRQI